MDFRERRRGGFSGIIRPGKTRAPLPHLRHAILGIRAVVAPYDFVAPQEVMNEAAVQHWVETLEQQTGAD
ncbi:hypothetical protein [Nitrosococcus watsonii]|uniref:hypothetical protein n=1 Tax=Nitrosococcus watsonii TaxID=473531 RepID=UPI0002E09A59|nr:hypothetical protein [Nitrosococcus watsonii]